MNTTEQVIIQAYFDITPLRRPISDANMQLIKMQQARALSSLDTSEMDADITSRVLSNPCAWSLLGALVVDRVSVDYGTDWGGETIKIMAMFSPRGGTGRSSNQHDACGSECRS
jgi:hypothetical protein